MPQLASHNCRHGRVAEKYSPATSYGNRGLRDTDVLTMSTPQQLRMAVEAFVTRTCCQGVLPSNFVRLRIAAAAVCSGRDLLDTDVLPGSTPQKLRVHTGCTPQSSSTLQQAVASSQTRSQGPCHDRGQDQPKIGDMHGQSQPFAKPCFGLAFEFHLARVETHQRCQLPRFELPSN